MKMMIAYKYNGKYQVKDLETFKQQTFFCEEKFGKVCIYDFHYVFSQREEIEYKQYIKSLSIQKLKKLNL